MAARASLTLPLALLVSMALGSGAHAADFEDMSRCSSADVKAIAQSHLARVDQKIEELQALSATLRDLVARCHGDDRPDCPIMDDLTPSDLAGTRKHRAGTTL